MKKLTLHRVVIMTLVALSLSVGFFPRRAHAAQMVEGSSGMYRIQNGDTLSGIATDACGKTSLWPTIAKLNGIAAPYVIYKGQTIAVDCKTEEPTVLMASKISGSPVEEVPSADAVVSLAFETDENSVNPTVKLFAPTTDGPIIGLAPQPRETIATASRASSPVSNSLLTSKKADDVTQATKKVGGYQFVISGSNLQGPLQTQLILFNTEEEKRLGLPSERVDLKPSIAVPANDGDTAVFVRLKKLPKQPFNLLVGGIINPIDSTQIQASNGKIPGQHSFVKLMVSIGKIAAPAGIGFVTGGPLMAAGAIAVPRIINFVIAQHEKAATKKIEAVQAAVDKSKLALYRASTESNSLSKEIQ